MTDFNDWEPPKQMSYMPDAKGREHVHTMTDRELLEECVTTQRQMIDLAEYVSEALQKNPMMKMMLGKAGA